jgi:radical SAM protein with 4Fe4S-binding SPASM domain
MYLKLISDNENDIFQNYGKPYYVYISLSNICNANCQFCGVRKNKEKTNKLDIKKVIDELSELGTKYIHFTGGGEPFINNDIVEYIEYANSKQIKVVFISNGLALNEEIIKKIAPGIAFCFFSIDSHRADIHNDLRRTENLFETATHNINLIKKYNAEIKIVLNHVVNTKNIDDFYKFIKMKSIVDFDFINPIVVKDMPSLFPAEQQIKKYNDNVNFYNDLAEKYQIYFLGNGLNIFNDNGDRNANDDIKCVYPSFCAFIDCPTGNVYPCDCSMWRDPELYKIGNLLNNRFADVWQSDKKHLIQGMLSANKLECVKKCDESNCLFNRRYKKFKDGTR